jgi:hypothetical protein
MQDTLLKIKAQAAACHLTDMLTTPSPYLHHVAAAEPGVLRFIQLTYMLILKEHCWVARKNVVKYRISAEARFVVSCDRGSSSHTRRASLRCLYGVPYGW